MSKRNFATSIAILLCACFAQNCYALDFNLVFKFKTKLVDSKLAITGYERLHEPEKGEKEIKPSEITSMTIPSTIELITENALKSFNGLHTLNFPEGGKLILEGNSISTGSLQSLTIDRYITNTTGIFQWSYVKKIVIGDNVTALNITFDSCKQLESVSISNRLKTINDRMFQHCI